MIDKNEVIDSLQEIIDCLRKYEDYYLLSVLMRKDDDNRDDVIVKEEMYNEHNVEF